MDETPEEHNGLIITVYGRNWSLTGDEVFTFGRAENCTLCLGTEDAGISRRAGEIGSTGGIWFVTNRSASRPLSLVNDFGLRSVLGPGQRSAVEGRLRVFVEGTSGRHELVLQGPPSPDDPAAAEADPGTATASAHEGMLNDADRRALVALFAGYLLEGKRHDPAPRSYQAAAARLGQERTTVIKRVEYIRTRLTKAGVPNMQGPQALTALAEYVLTNGLIRREDLRLIGL